MSVKLARRLFGSALLVSFSLAGCAGANLVDVRQPPPGPPAFRDGYVDGCLSGFSDGRWYNYAQSYRKDIGRYQADSDYRKGWDDGHSACYVEAIRYPRVGSSRG